MIIMENLIPKGFVFISHGDISSNKVLDYDYTTCVIKTELEG